MCYRHINGKRLYSNACINIEAKPFMNDPQISGGIRLWPMQDDRSVATIG